jgi:hypothetical protein
MQLMTIARYLASKAVKEKWRLEGRKVQYIHASEITKASNAYLALHMAELMMEAAIRHREQQRFICGTPFETQLMQERWKRLVKEAIRNKRGKVNSIAQASFTSSLGSIWPSTLIVAGMCTIPEMRSRAVHGGLG